jgi:tetratricopeptide (TPR) repeat protein
MKMKFMSGLCFRLPIASCLAAVLIAQGQQPSTEAGRRQAALAFEQEGRSGEAETEWKAIATADPKNAEAYAHLGLLEARQEHYREAISNYCKALAINPQFPNLRINLGLSYFKAGELKDTIRTYEPLLKELPGSSPQRPRIVTLVGLAQYGLGNYAAAVPYLNEAVADDPQNLQFRLMHSHSCLWSKQYPCVLDEYREIVTINPNAAEAYMLAGEAYDELKDDTNALAQFQTAVKADSKAPNAHFGYGYLLWRLMRFDEAEAEFRAELANNPEHALALAYLGDAEVHLQRNEQAEPYLEHSIRIDPSFALAHLDLGAVYEDRGRKADALREFQVSEKLDPNDENAHWRLARLYQSLGRKEDAKSEIEKTRSLQKVRDEPLVEKIDRAKPDAAEQNATQK